MPSITYDNSVIVQDSSGFNEPFTIGNNTHRIVLAGVISNRSIGFHYLDYGGGIHVEPDFEDNYDFTGGSGTKLYIYYWINPPVGTPNIHIAFNSSSSMNKILSAISLYNAEGIGATATNYVTDSPLSTTIGLLHKNSMTVEFQAVNAGGALVSDIIQDNSQTEREQLLGADVSAALATKAFSGTGNQILGFSTGVSTYHGTYIMEIAVAGAFNQGNFMYFE